MSHDALVGYDWPQVLRALGIPMDHFKVRSTGVMVGLCFFHKEKTPSLVLWPKSKRWICFGCGISEQRYMPENDMLLFASLYLKHRGIHPLAQKELLDEITKGNFFSFKVDNPDQLDLFSDEGNT